MPPYPSTLENERCLGLSYPNQGTEEESSFFTAMANGKSKMRIHVPTSGVDWCVHVYVRVSGIELRSLHMLSKQSEL